MGVQGCAGATILGGGNVALIMDVGAMVKGAAQPNLLFADSGPELYRPYRQAPSAFPTFLIAAVSRTEAFIFDVLWMILHRYPEKLGLSLQGNRGELNVPLAALLEADSLDQVKESMIERRLNGVAYAKPREYLRLCGFSWE